MYLLGGFGTNALLDALGGDKLPVWLVLIVSIVTGFLASELEIWILKNKGRWPKMFLSRVIFFTILWIAFSFTVATSILYIASCSVSFEHGCSLGPPFPVKAFFIFILSLIYALPIGSVIGFINHLILSSIFQDSKKKTISHLPIHLPQFTAQDRLGGIGLFGILIAIPFFLVDQTQTAGVILLLSALFLFSALIAKFRDKQADKHT
jgi:hypothetical protein